jgi:hypothetical protein
MKIILTIILLIGMFVLGCSIMSFGLTKARSLSIQSHVINLRNKANYEKCQETRDSIRRSLKAISALFKPMMWTGAVLIVLALLGLIIEVKRTGRREVCHDDLQLTK